MPGLSANQKLAQEGVSRFKKENFRKLPLKDKLLYKLGIV